MNEAQRKGNKPASAGSPQASLLEKALAYGRPPRQRTIIAEEAELLIAFLDGRVGITAVARTLWPGRNYSGVASAVYAWVAQAARLAFQGGWLREVTPDERSATRSR
jgi:hypothetical protein